MDDSLEVFLKIVGERFKYLFRGDFSGHQIFEFAAPRNSGSLIDSTADMQLTNSRILKASQPKGHHNPSWASNSSTLLSLHHLSVSALGAVRPR